MAYIGKIPSPVPLDASDIPANSIDATKLIDGSITLADIANDAVTADKLHDDVNTVIAANTAKTGITSGQASAITANTAKVTNSTNASDLASGTVAAARLDTATTQAESDDSTKIATTAYVVDKITTLIGGAPSTLNDLNELALAINDDASYNSTLTTALATKLPKAGGTMTGTITNFRSTGIDDNASGALAITIDSNEKVGIGIATPDSQLHVHGIGTLLSSDSYFIAQIQTDRNDDGSNDDGALQFVNGSGKTVKGEIRWDESTNTFELGHGDNQGHLVIASGGNVGIGTTSPDSVGSVSGLSGNNFKVGSTSNASRLIIEGAGSADIHLADMGGSSDSRQFRIRADADKLTFASATENFGTIRDTLTIDHDGNVGIRTTAPNHQLTVNGVIKTMSNNSIANNYSIVKYLTGSQAAITAITMTIPATPCFIGIEMFGINTRIIDGNASTSRIGKKYFTIARYGSGHDVVLEQGYSDDEFTHVTASVGGAYYTGNGDTSIVREGSEANTASQNVKITFQPGRPGHTGGKACLKFDILALITGNDGAFVVDA